MTEETRSDGASKIGEKKSDLYDCFILQRGMSSCIGHLCGRARYESVNGGPTDVYRAGSGLSIHQDRVSIVA